MKKESNVLPVHDENDVQRDQSIIDGFLERAKSAEALIPDLLKNGCGFIPYDDMVVYMITCTPKFSEEELQGIDTKVLDVLFEGDKDGDVSDQKLTIIARGKGCKKEFSIGDRVAIRGNAFKVTTPKGTFLAVREYDVIGKYA